MSAWFKRKDKGIQTPTEEKKDVPKGLWYKTPSGKIVDTDELKENHYVSPEDGYHVRIGSNEYFEILFDENKYKELNTGITSKDPLKFEDTKKYPDRLKEAQEKTKLKDAVRTAVGKSLGKDIVVAAMDFKFIGGSMGSVVGEKIASGVTIDQQAPIHRVTKGTHFVLQLIEQFAAVWVNELLKTILIPIAFLAHQAPLGEPAMRT